MFGSFENLYFYLKRHQTTAHKQRGPDLLLPQISKVKLIVNKTFFWQMHDRNVCIGSLKSPH